MIISACSTIGTKRGANLKTKKVVIHFRPEFVFVLAFLGRRDRLLFSRTYVQLLVTEMKEVGQTNCRSLRNF
jgi:hypothetical protein